ncbi:unnamed protein product [Rotaria sp. Silwood1]|nr:unnamed protein product [Rotaria sp. Silwood1]
MSSNALHFEVTHTCKTTKARVGRLKLSRNHTSRGPIETPVFMPVGTQGTLKGLTPEQLHQLNCRIILGNTYHLNQWLLHSTNKNNIYRGHHSSHLQTIRIFAFFLFCLKLYQIVIINKQNLS